MIIIQNKVFDLVKKIPKGKVATYKIIAQKLNIKNYRLVGYFLKNNQSLLKIPCHRVVKSNGEVGGYKLGTTRKIQLLKKEGIPIKNKRIINFKNYLIKFQ